MKKIIKITIPAQEARVIEKEVHICDFCNLERDTTSCILCDRSICYGGVPKQCGVSDPKDWGDYPGYYCRICYNLKFEKYKSEFDKMDQRHYDEMELFNERLKQESLTSKLPI